MLRSTGLAKDFLQIRSCRMRLFFHPLLLLPQLVLAQRCG